MTGTVYFNGQPLTRGELPPCTLSEGECEHQDGGTPITQEISGSISFTTHISARQMLMLMTGKFPSNNWLKMHGGVMERKIWRAKHDRNGSNQNTSRNKRKIPREYSRRGKKKNSFKFSGKCARYEETNETGHHI